VLIPGKAGDGALDASRVVTDDLLGFDAMCSHWAVGDLQATGGATAGTDEIIGIDGATDVGSRCRNATNAPIPRLVILDTNEASAKVQTLEAVEKLAPGRLELIDLDTDGDLDLVVFFSGKGSLSLGSDGAVGFENDGVIIFWNDAGQLTLTSGFASVDNPGEGRLLSVQAIDLNSDRYKDLLLLTRGALYKSVFDPNTDEFQPAIFVDAKNLSTDAEKGRTIRVADMNGDGLDDFAMTVGNQVRVWLAVPDAPLGAQMLEERGAP